MPIRKIAFLAPLCILSFMTQDSHARQAYTPPPQEILSKVDDLQRFGDVISTRDIKLKQCPNGLLVEYNKDCQIIYYTYCDETKQKVCPAFKDLPQKEDGNVPTTD